MKNRAVYTFFLRKKEISIYWQSAFFQKKNSREYFREGRIVNIFDIARFLGDKGPAVLYVGAECHEVSRWFIS